MTQAFLTTTREKRASSNIRSGSGAQNELADKFYTVSYKAIDTPAKNLVPFQKTSGRRVVEHQALDLHYNDMDAFHRLHNRAYKKGAMYFDKMYSCHDDALTDPRVCRPLGGKAGGSGGGPVFQLRRGADPRARYTGPQLTTFEVQKKGIEMTYARDMGNSGPSMIPWTRMTSRDQRERSFKDDRMSSTRMPGLHISYKAVDFEADKVVKFIPKSNSATARGRPSSAASRLGKNRPQSASAAVRNLRESVESSQQYGGNDYTEVPFSSLTPHLDTTATGTATSNSPSPSNLSPSRPPSGMEQQRHNHPGIGRGNVMAPPQLSLAPPYQLDDAARPPIAPYQLPSNRRPQSAGPRSNASEQKWDPETCDPIAAFNSSTRILARNLTFSKASRWK